MPPLSSASDRRFEQLRMLTEISRALTYVTGSQEVLTLATARAAALLEAESAILMLTDEEGILRIRATVGVDHESLEHSFDRLDESLIQRLTSALGAPVQESFLGVPMVVHGAVTGLLAVVRRNGSSITEEEEWLLSAVADQVAVAMENARLQEELRQQRESRATGGAADEADGVKDRALATLSHDLRSPLNAIDSYAELIEMEIMGPVTDRQREAIGRIRMSGRHLLAVLENVLEMARINAGVIRVHAGTVAARRVVEEAVLLVRPSAIAKGQVLTVEPIADLVLQADPDRLRQVLVNVLGNAVKYTQPTGSIRIGAALRESEAGQLAAISVTDTGPGIPPDQIQAVFRPYYRISSDASTAPEGTGLGLAISRELIRRMGGEIEVTSEVGQGSTFTVVLPVSTRARAQEPRAPEATEEPCGEVPPSE